MSVKNINDYALRETLENLSYVYSQNNIGGNLNHTGSLDEKYVDNEISSITKMLTSKKDKSKTISSRLVDLKAYLELEVVDIEELIDDLQSYISDLEPVVGEIVSLLEQGENHENQ